MILAGDIGGTKTDLALFHSDRNQLSEVRHETYPSKEFRSLDELIRIFLKREDRAIDSACFGVAGPVLNGRCETTNLPWIVDAKELSESFKISSVIVLNDLEAMAYGTLSLAEKDFYPLNSVASNARGNRCLIAAGTGLGEAILFCNGPDFLISATEGGHVDFAPRNETEIRLLEFMLHRHPRVSYERILSGPGVYQIYQFLLEASASQEPAWLRESLDQGDPGEVISEAALSGKSDLCEKTLNLFISIYGSEAGNLALKVMARGGVYIGGGIARKLLRKLKEGTFVNSFRDKGRMSPLMSQMPVKVILNQNTSLLGAAQYSARFA